MQIGCNLQNANIALGLLKYLNTTGQVVYIQHYNN